MALLDLPKNPKVTDLIPLLNALDQRISALEAYVVKNDTRITALENRQRTDSADLHAHEAGAVERQAEINDLRWALARGRKTPRRR